MKMLSAALAAATFGGGLAATAAPADAHCSCRCPVVYHHPVHRSVRREAVYHYLPAPPPPAPIVYREAPPPPPPPIYYDEPAYYAGPIWYGGPRHFIGGRWYGGWERGGYHGWGWRGHHWR
ncbi:MAG TPA: hypothetical protein VHZ26_01290 [Caulobacteraceae bacterium]|jgi:hypothetical protein|nr:hypothetical protein [Caulobacteraceae bacterium]